MSEQAGYNTGQTLHEAISDYSTLGGMIYGFLGSFLEQFIRKEIGISGGTFFNPSTSTTQRINSSFARADLALSDKYMAATSWAYSPTGANSFLQDLAQIIQSRNDGVSSVAPNLQQLMLDVGVRQSYVNPSKSVLDRQYAFHYYDTLGAPPGTIQQRLYDFYTESLQNKSFGLTTGELSDLSKDYIKSNLYQASKYIHDNTVRDLYFDKSDVGYTLSEGAIDSIEKSIKRIQHMTFRKDDEGYIYMDGDSQHGDEWAIFDDLAEKAGAFKGALKLDVRDGKLVANTSGVVKSFSDAIKNFQEYAEGIKSWSETLNTTIEQAKAQLNSIANMDVAGTFTGNYNTLKDTALMAKHINALSGKGNAYAQTAVHAAGQILGTMGGDRAAAFMVGTQAAMMYTDSKYRVNEAEQDAYNVTMQAAAQHSPLALRIAGVYALGGYSNDEKGRAEFEKELKEAGIKPNELTVAKAKKFLAGKGVKVTTAQLEAASKTDAALDFNANSTMGLNAAIDEQEKVWKDTILAAVDPEDAKAVQEIFYNPRRTRELFNALTLDPNSANSALSKLGLKTNFSKLQANMFDMLSRGGELANFGGDLRKMTHAFAARSNAKVREEEVKARVAAEKTMRTFDAGNGMWDTISNALNAKGEDVTVQDAVRKMFFGTSVDAAMASFFKNKDGKFELSDTKRNELNAVIDYQKDLQKAFTELDLGDVEEVRKQALDEHQRRVKIGAYKTEKDRLDAEKQINQLLGFQGKYDKTGKLVGFSGTIKKTELPDKDTITNTVNNFSKPFKTEYDKTFSVINDKNVIEQGTQAEKELAAARSSAVDRYRENQNAISELQEKYNSTPEKDTKQRAAIQNQINNLQSRSKAIKTKMENLGVTQTDDGKFVVNHNKDADYSKAVASEKSMHSESFKSAAERLGIKELSPIERALNVIISILQAIQKK